MSIRKIRSAAIRLSVAAVVLWTAGTAAATSNHAYGADEYVTINDGISPDGRLAIATHGEGELGYDHFHAYLFDAVTSKKIGPARRNHRLARHRRRCVRREVEEGFHGDDDHLPGRPARPAEGSYLPLRQGPCDSGDPAARGPERRSVDPVLG